MDNEPVTITVAEGFKVDVTPELLAKAFWKMYSDQQADFFDALAREITANSPKAYGFGEMQWCFLKDELRKPGREVANQMHMALSAFAFDFWPPLQGGARTGIN